MTEEKLKQWDMKLKIIGLIAVIASGLWTLYKFRQDRKVDLEHEAQTWLRDEDNKKRELNSSIFQRQSALYFDASDAVATMATAVDPQMRAKAQARFEALYYGQLVIVEDRRVELAMITIERCLETGKEDCDRYPFDDHNRRIPDEHMKLLGPGSLKNLSLELSACIRTALEADRRIDFGSLSDPKSICPYDHLS